MTTLYDARTETDAVRQAQREPLYRAWLESHHSTETLATMALIADRDGYEFVGFDGVTHHSPGAISYDRAEARAFYARLRDEAQREDLRDSAASILAHYQIAIESVSL